MTFECSESMRFNYHDIFQNENRKVSDVYLESEPHRASNFNRFASTFSVPQISNSRITGERLMPNSVSEYSTRGGISLNCSCKRSN